MKYKVTSNYSTDTNVFYDEKKARLFALDIAMGVTGARLYVTEYSMDERPTGRWTRVQRGVIITNK